MTRTFYAVHATARQGAAALCMSIPDGWQIKFSEPRKRRIQEERYHAMLADIARQCTHIGREWDAESWKRLLIDDYVAEARTIAKGEGRPDPFPAQGDVIPSISGRGIVQFGVQSRGFTVRQAADFITYLFAFGAERNVRWSDPMEAPLPARECVA